MNGRKKTKRKTTLKKTGARKSARPISNEKFFLEFLESQISETKTPTPKKSGVKKQKTQRAKTKRVKSVIAKNLNKRRGKEIYDVFFKTGAKSKDELIDGIEKIRNLKELPDGRVKFTFVARYKNKVSSITQLYDIDEPHELNEVLRETLDSIFKKPVRGTTKSIRRMNRLKNYINRIVIDFQSAE